MPVARYVPGPGPARRSATSDFPERTPPRTSVITSLARSLTVPNRLGRPRVSSGSDPLRQSGLLAPGSMPTHRLPSRSQWLFPIQCLPGSGGGVLPGHSCGTAPAFHRTSLSCVRDGTGPFVRLSIWGELVAQHLSQRIAGEGVDEDDAARALEAGQ